jgi:hypothetical protein
MSLIRARGKEAIGEVTEEVGNLQASWILSVF